MEHVFCTMPSVGCWEAETSPTIPGVKELPVPSAGTRHQCCDTGKQRAVGAWGADPGGQGYVKPAWEVRVDFLEEVTMKLHSKRRAGQAKGKGIPFRVKEMVEKARHKGESLWEALSLLCRIGTLEAPGGILGSSRDRI